MVKINQDGRRYVVINALASYGGGSGPLIAIEGEEAQIVALSSSYRRGVCVAVADDHILFQIDGDILRFLFSEIERYDQFHLPSKMRSTLY